MSCCVVYNGFSVLSEVIAYNMSTCGEGNLRILTLIMWEILFDVEYNRGWQILLLTLISLEVFLKRIDCISLILWFCSLSEMPHIKIGIWAKLWVIHTLSGPTNKAWWDKRDFLST